MHSVSFITNNIAYRHSTALLFSSLLLLNKAASPTKTIKMHKRRKRYIPELQGDTMRRPKEKKERGRGGVLAIK